MQPLLIITFALVVAIVFGAYWFFIERPQTQEGAALRRRIRKAGQPGKAAKALLRERERFSAVGVIDRGLSRLGGGSGRLQRMIAQSGLKVTVASVLLASGCLAGLGYLAVANFAGLRLIGVVVAVMAAFLPFIIINMARSRRMLKFEEQFPEAIDLLARALRAGHALTTGLSMIAEELPAPAGPEFKLLFDQQNFGMPLPQALKEFATRVPSLDARFFATAVLTQRESGGNLSEVLDNLASIIRDRFRVKRQVRVISAHGRITGWVLSALPVSLGLFFAFTSPEKYRAFYTDPFGMQMIMGALVLQVIGVFIISRIVKIEY
jgi:tight adherence protein B